MAWSSSLRLFEMPICRGKEYENKNKFPILYIELSLSQPVDPVVTPAASSCADARAGSAIHDILGSQARLRHRKMKTTHNKTAPLQRIGNRYRHLVSLFTMGQLGLNFASAALALPHRFRLVHLACSGASSCSDSHFGNTSPHICLNLS